MKNNGYKKFVAFTLAEVLITLAIIGVVAALTVPTLVKNYQSKQYETSQKVLMTNLRNAMKNMQVNDKLSGYDTTMDFVQELSKYLKITKICDSSHLPDCFNEEFISDDEIIKAEDIKSSKNLGKEYNDNNAGIVTVNGITAIVTYNPECNVSGMNFQDTHSMSCLGMIYDLNGKSNPNKISTDIRLFNAELSNNDDTVTIGGITFDVKSFGSCPLDIASATKYCNDKGGRLPTESEMRTAVSTGDEFINKLSENGISVNASTNFAVNHNYYHNSLGFSVGAKNMQTVCADSQSCNGYALCIKD